MFSLTIIKSLFQTISKMLIKFKKMIKLHQRFLKIDLNLLMKQKLLNKYNCNN